MSLIDIEIKANLKTLVEQVKRIADVLERDHPVPLPREPYTPEDVLLQDNEALWKREMETEADQKAGLKVGE